MMSEQRNSPNMAVGGKLLALFSAMAALVVVQDHRAHADDASAIVGGILKIIKHAKSPDSRPQFLQDEKESSLYGVSGVHVGQKINPRSLERSQFFCQRSEIWRGFFYCSRTRHERERRGEFNVTDSLLYSDSSGVAYINKSLSPAFWGVGEVDGDLSKLRREYGEALSIVKMPEGANSSRGTIAVWGSVSLEPLDPSGLQALISDRGPKEGLLVDFLNNPTLSAQRGLPVYRVSGGAGYVWIATVGADSKGKLRFFASNMSLAELGSRTPAVTSEARSHTNSVERNNDNFSSWWGGSVHHNTADTARINNEEMRQLEGPDYPSDDPNTILDERRKLEAETLEDCARISAQYIAQRRKCVIDGLRAWAMKRQLAVARAAQQKRQADEDEKQRIAAEEQKRLAAEEAEKQQQAAEAEHNRLVEDARNKGPAYAAKSETEWQVKRSADEMTDQEDVSVISNQSNDTGITGGIEGFCVTPGTIKFTVTVTDNSGQPNIHTPLLGPDIADDASVAARLRINDSPASHAALLVGKFTNQYTLATIKVGSAEAQSSSNDPGGTILAIAGAFKALRSQAFGYRSSAIPFDVDELWRLMFEIETDHGSLLLKIPFYDHAIEQLENSCKQR